MVSDSWPRVRGTPANAVVPAAVAVDVAAAAAAARRATVAVAAIGVAGAAAAREVRAEDSPVDGVVGCDHCRDACPRACPTGVVHGLHLHPRFDRRLHEQRPAHGLRRSSALVLIGTSPPEQTQLPGLTTQNLLASHTDEFYSGNGKSDCLIQYV